MSRWPSLGTILTRCVVLVSWMGGCNTILDNRPGKVDPSAAIDLTPARASDGGLAESLDPSLCAPGQRTCHGTCVGDMDPSYGCGSSSCQPCTTAHATAACRAHACVVEACDHGHADCNQDSVDGCEVDLSRAETCGACATRCPASRPVCAPSGNSYHCTTGCTAAAPLRCGDECVSPLTSVNHCGECNAKCAAIEHADVSCTERKCTFTCKPGYHACAGRCVVNSDPNTCGPTCGACPVPTNAAATCQADACAFRCNDGFGDCNRDATDGCETPFATDPLNCGGCGKACDGGTCKDGACTGLVVNAGR